jgi:hypothetical protein
MKTNARTSAAGTPLPASACPTCGYQMDAATYAGKGEHRPSPGDLAVCIRCAEVNVYQPDYTLRAASLDDLISLDPAGMQQITQAQRLIRQYRKIP